MLGRAGAKSGDPIEAKDFEIQQKITPKKKTDHVWPVDHFADARAWIISKNWWMEKIFSCTNNEDI